MKNKHLTFLTLLLVFCISTLSFASNNTVHNLNGVSNWALDDVSRSIEINIVPKELQNNYTQKITRAEFCNLVVQMLQAETNLSFEKLSTELKVNLKDNVFKDTNDSKIIFANKLGIVNGKGGGLFAPNDPITRQEAAKMLSNLSGVLGLKNSNNIQLSHKNWLTDNKISDWARADIDIITNLGIMRGVSDSRFGALENYTREQSFVTILRLLDAYNTFDRVPSAFDKFITEDESEDFSDSADEPLTDIQDDEEPVIVDDEELVIVDEEELVIVDKDVQKMLDQIKSTIYFNKENHSYYYTLDSTSREAYEAGIITKEMIDRLINEKSFETRKLNIEEAKAEVLRLANVERAKVNVAPLSKCTSLAKYADIRANEIVKHYAHERPDGSEFYSGISGYRTVGENIAIGQQSAEEVMIAWMNSPGHRKNILNPDFKELSVGVVNRIDEYGVYWVQIFFTAK